MAGKSRQWQPVGVDSDLERGPSTIPPVPHVRGRIELLPFEALTWPDFESLQWRILRDVEGLRHAQIYGDPGQSQHGLDIIAVAADESGVALQSKRVEQFGPAKITAAVNAFRNTKRPFGVSRFIVGVSREIRTREALDRFRQLQTEMKPIEFELWDKRELSLKLKRAPEIVLDYFGNDVAELFCDPFEIAPRIVPTRDAAAIREAIARTPEVTTGAGAKIAEAKVLAENGDADAALALVEEAQKALTGAGFAGHAAQHDALCATLLVTVGRGNEASRRCLDKIWFALDRGHTTSAQIASHDISNLAQKVNTKSAREHQSVADAAIGLYSNPLAVLPGLADLKLGHTNDHARLAALAGETALAAGNHTWLKTNAIRMRNVATALPQAPEHDTLRVRLRILTAEGSGKWAPVLGDARSLQLGYSLGALVLARHARHLALNHRFAEADASWDEAAGSACLAERWTDAARWIFCRRAFRGRWQPFSTDQFLPAQTALSARGPNPTVLERDEDALEYAAGQLADDKLRPAAIAAQRALRDAVSLSDWEGERRARRLLADILDASGEQQMAADHLVLAAETSRLKQLGTEQSSTFLDISRHLDAKPWWIVGAAYSLLATQADLIPDDTVATIADHAIADITAGQNGKLVDLPGFAGSRYLGAFAALAGIAERLTANQAEKVLAVLEAQPSLEPGHYRHQDEDEAKTVAGITTTHPNLTDRGLAHLIKLLGRSEVSRKAKTHDVVTDRLEEGRPVLEELAAEGNSWAQEVLNTEQPERVSADQINDARTRLEQPLIHTPGVFTVGGGSSSLPDSALVRRLPAKEQLAALQQLIDRASSPYVSAPDRASYLLAASNLRAPADASTRTTLVDRALALVLSPPLSAADAAEDPYQSPLGFMRINRGRDSRGEAAHLAAALARTRHDKERVRAATFSLVGDDTTSAYWVTRALQRLGETMAPDLGFLSGQNWALKSFAAIQWAKTTEPEPVGFRLATDVDVRVRRVLATHLVESERNEDAGTLKVRPSGPAAVAKRSSARAALLDMLRQDPCYSVRSAATTDTSMP